MKKLLTLCAAVALMFAVASCGKAKEAAEGAADAATEAAEGAEDAASQEEAKDEGSEESS